MVPGYCYSGFSLTRIARNWKNFQVSFFDQMQTIINFNVPTMAD